ncbi:MAG: T9SS type A sorting domain-containing protein [Ignavibacterium sp.]|nr:T9SS type A sorting domain-containing protein [Ignavibacterium sp.]
MKNTTVLLIILSLINGITLLAQNYGVWKEIDSMNIARVGHAIVELPDGNLLVSGNGVDSVQSSCEIYDNKTGLWRFTSWMNISRSDHSMVKLNNEKVIAVGGYREKSCELFDYRAEKWSMTDSLIFERWFGQTVLKLSDGRVMVIGGLYYDTTTVPWQEIILDKVEIFDELTNQWNQVSSLNIGRFGHTATLLNDGRVLVTGGQTANGITNLCEIYNPVNNTWTPVSSMNENREEHSALLLDSNRVLVTGSGGLLQNVKKSCEVYLIRENIWIAAGDMFIYRYGHSMIKVPHTKKVIIIGGDVGNSFYCNDSYEFYNTDSLISESLLPFPTSQMLGYGFLSSVSNIFQTLNNKIFVLGNVEVTCYPSPLAYPTRRCWIFDVTTDVDQDKKTIIGYKLNQNFPNPFNPQTTISYELPFNAYVKLIVYDILGNEVEILINEFQYAGTYDVNFKAKSLSSGIYYYRLTVMETEKSNGITFQQTKKMILLR